jgi:hypothetical protein
MNNPVRRSKSAWTCCSATPKWSPRDDGLNRQLGLQVATGRLDAAIGTMTSHSFAVAEGASLNVAEHWADAHILRARNEIREKRYPEALADLAAPGTVPSNVPASGAGAAIARAPELAYWEAVASEGAGEERKAAEAWKRASVPVAAAPVRNPAPSGAAQGPATTAQMYYQALALRKLGQEDAARTLLQGLVRFGEGEVREPAPDGAPATQGQTRLARARVADGHYLAGLGYLGLDDQAGARAQLAEALAATPDLVGARAALAAMTAAAGNPEANSPRRK